LLLAAHAAAADEVRHAIAGLRANRRRGFRLVHTECCGRTPSASVGTFTYGGDGCWGMRAVLQGYEMQSLLALGGGGGLEWV
jgi:hypothetical protein